jgi:hypothetical protein
VLLAKGLSPDCGGLPVDHRLTVFGNVGGRSLCDGWGEPSIENPFKMLLREKSSCQRDSFISLDNISP